MARVKAISKAVWLLLLLAAVITQCFAKKPLSEPTDAVALIGLLILFGTHLVLALPWLNLLLNKSWLWLSNSSTIWSMEINWHIEMPDHPLQVLEDISESVSKSNPHAKRLLNNIDSRLKIDVSKSTNCSIYALESGEDLLIKASFDPMGIGYRDMRKFVFVRALKLIEAIENGLPKNKLRQFGFEAEMNGSNPFLMLAHLPHSAQAADAFYATITHPNGASLTLTGNRVQLSCETASQLRDGIDAVFGISLGSATSARHT